MPRFHFDLLDRDGDHIDDDGVDCADRDEAVRLARRTLSEMAIDLFRDPDQTEIAIRVREPEQEPIVLKVTLDTSGRD